MVVRPLQLCNTSSSAQEGDSLVKALSLQKTLWSRARCGISWLHKEHFSDYKWMETNLPPHHVMYKMGMRRKKRGSSLDFKRALEGYCMRQGKEETDAVTLMYLLHYILCLLSYEFVVFSLSPPSSIWITSSWKVTIVISSPDISLFC